MKADFNASAVSLSLWSSIRSYDGIMRRQGYGDGGREVSENRGGAGGGGGLRAVEDVGSRDKAKKEWGLFG